MNSPIAAALVAVLLTTTWLLGRRRVPLVRDTDTSGVAALNRAQIALVHSGGATQPELPLSSSASRRPPAPGAARRSASGRGGAWLSAAAVLPPSLQGTGPALSRAIEAAGGKAAHLARLQALYRGDTAARLEAIRAASQWGDRLTLPLLRRALRDSDPTVIRAAVEAIEPFRGRSAAAAAVPQPSPRPRRVARTR